MATTRRMAISTPPGPSIAYVCNDDKAEYVTGVNTSVEFASDEMMELQRNANGKTKRYAYHTIQSFSPNDPVTPETAHEIGVRLAKEIYPDYQSVVATHTDRGHIHNHIITSAVNMKTGERMRDRLYGSLSVNHIREVSDRLCREYGLSVLEEHRIGKYPHMHVSTLKKRPFRALRDSFRETFRRALSAKTEREFWNRVEDDGFTVRQRTQKKGPEVTKDGIFRRKRFFPVSQLVPYAVEKIKALFHHGFRKKKSDEKRIASLVEKTHDDYDPTMFFYFESARIASVAVKDEDHEKQDEILSALATLYDEDLAYPEDIDDKKERIRKRLAELYERLDEAEEKRDGLEQLAQKAGEYLRVSRKQPKPGSQEDAELKKLADDLAGQRLITDSAIRRVRNNYHAACRDFNRIQNRTDLLESRLESLEDLDRIKVPAYRVIRAKINTINPAEAIKGRLRFDVRDGVKAGDVCFIPLSPDKTYEVSVGQRQYSVAGKEITDFLKEQQKNIEK